MKIIHATLGFILAQLPAQATENKVHFLHCTSPQDHSTAVELMRNAPAPGEPGSSLQFEIHLYQGIRLEKAESAARVSGRKSTIYAGKTMAVEHFYGEGAGLLTLKTRIGAKDVKLQCRDMDLH